MPGQDKRIRAPHRRSDKRAEAPPPTSCSTDAQIMKQTAYKNSDLVRVPPRGPMIPCVSSHRLISEDAECGAQRGDEAHANAA